MARPQAIIRQGEPKWVKPALLGAVLLYLVAFLLLPLSVVLIEGLRKGVQVYWAAISDPITLAAVKLTLIAAGLAVPLNTVFGIAAAWCITKFDFRGRTLLLTLIDMPFSVSPVIAGNMPMKTEITPLLIITKLEEYDYAAATALGTASLIMAFVLLLAINRLQAHYDLKRGGI